MFVPSRLTKSWIRIKYNPHAEVAELADALGSGLSGLTVVRVQVPPSAQETRGNAGVLFNDSGCSIFQGS